MEQALQGIKVVDFSKWLPGQYCGMVLADYGADVIKLESPQGDPNRAFDPHLAPGQSSWNLALNRNKRGVSVNLKTAEGREVVRRLLREADVFLEGFRPGYLAAKGLGWDEMHALNPRLIYCSITGFGQTGKYSHKPAHDLNIVGLAGMDFLADKGKPAVSEVQVSALGGSLNAVAAISMALVARERTGGGQYIDISLYNTALGLQIVSAAAILGCRAAGGRPFGRRAPLKDRQYDFAHEAEITEKLTRAIAAKTRAEWVALTGGGEDCVTPVYSLDEALDTELTKESGMLETRTEDLHGTACDITYLKPAMRLSATPGRIRRRAPYVGEDNREVLRALGYRDEEIDALREKGAI